MKKIMKKVIGIFVILTLLLFCGCTQPDVTTCCIDEVTLLEGETYTILNTTINITLVDATSGHWRGDCEMTLKVEHQNETTFHILASWNGKKQAVIYDYTLIYVDTSDVIATFEVWR